VEIINDSKKKLQLQYPCSWCYKLIGENKDNLRSAIKSIIKEKPYTLTNSNQSKNGKYISMNLELLIDHEDERKYLYEALKQHKHIKTVL